MLVIRCPEIVAGVAAAEGLVGAHRGAREGLNAAKDRRQSGGKHRNRIGREEKGRWRGHGTVTTAYIHSYKDYNYKTRPHKSIDNAS